VVDAHDGKIDILGRGRGTHFRVTLPVSGADDWFTVKTTAAGAPRSTQG
jgi:nitrogen-specific signal transduction histidine kinase